MRPRPEAAELGGGIPGQHVVDQRALPRPADAGDAGQGAQGNPGVDVLEVVDRGVADARSTAWRSLQAAAGRPGRCRACVAEVAAGDGDRLGGELLGRPVGHDRPPSGPAPGPRSTTQSAARITASSCSTTTTLLPCPGACAGWRSADRCRGDAARPSARRGRSRRRPAPSRAAPPAARAGARRRRACRSRDPASGSRARPRSRNRSRLAISRTSGRAIGLLGRVEASARRRSALRS